jgi:chromosome segregation ATPase
MSAKSLLRRPSTGAEIQQSEAKAAAQLGIPLELQVDELRRALLTVTKACDEHDSRISALESNVGACLRGTQSANKGLNELRARDDGLTARMEALERANEKLEREVRASSKERPPRGHRCSDAARGARAC